MRRVECFVTGGPAPQPCGRDAAAVGAPSALGIHLARRLGMCLAGFVCGRAMTVYSGIEALA
jgi:hypothetical protein